LITVPKGAANENSINKNGKLIMFAYVLVNKAVDEIGYSEAAIRAKISDGTWQEFQQWIKAPDGRIMIIIEGVNQWVEAGLESKQHLKAVSKSPSCIKAKGVAKGLSLSPPPLT
jgi:hypothetical protein